MDNICKLFSSHLEKFRRLQAETAKQAYIFRLSLYSMENKDASVQYLKKALGEKLCDHFQNTTNLHNLQEKVHQTLPDYLKDCCESILFSFQCIFRFLHPTEKGRTCCQQTQSQSSSKFTLSPVEEKILEAMDMKKYYPQKLTSEEVNKLTKDCDVNMKTKITVRLTMVFHKTCTWIRQQYFRELPCSQ